jgi:copper transport protein
MPCLRSGQRSALAAVLLMVLLALHLGAAAHVEAHANLVSSEPPENAVLDQAPAEIKLTFSEQPELVSSQVYVLDAAGNHVENNDLHVHSHNTLGITVPDLPKGTYTVVWKTVSAVDGHVTRGTFGFGIGVAPPAPGSGQAAANALAGSAPPRWLGEFGKWITYVSMFAIIGAIAFTLFVLRPALRKSGLANEVPTRGAVGARAILAVSVVLLVASLLVTIVDQSWASSGSSRLDTIFGSGLRTVVFHTRFGRVWIARAILTGLAISAVAAFGMDWPRLVSKANLRSGSLISAAFVALTLPVTVSLNSHAAANEDWATLATAADWVHLVAGGIWVGGLAQFVFVVMLMLRRQPMEKRIAFLGAAIPRFSVIAIASVVCLVATGVFQWWVEIGGLHDTLHSAYGQTLTVKVALLVPLLALGAVNLLLLGPRLAGHSGEHSGEKGQSHVIAFRLAVAAELTIATGILVAAAVLTSGSPPSSSAQSAPQGFQSGVIVQRQSSGDVDLTLSVDPGQAGPNTIDFFLQKEPSSENPIERFVVRFTYLDDNLGTTEDDATEQHPTHYQLTGSQLSLAGRWKIEVTIRRTGLLDVVIPFEVQVQPPVTPGPGPSLTPAATTTTAPSGPTINLSADNSESFSASSLTAAAGPETIVFTNNDDGVAHDVHLYKGSDASGESLGATQLTRGPDTQSLGVDLEPGTYFFQCDIHPQMQGTIEVVQ